MEPEEVTWLEKHPFSVWTNLITNKIKRAFPSFLVWYCTPVFPALEKLRQKDFGSKTSIVYSKTVPKTKPNN